MITCSGLVSLPSGRSVSEQRLRPFAAFSGWGRIAGFGPSSRSVRNSGRHSFASASGASRKEPNSGYRSR